MLPSFVRPWTTTSTLTWKSSLASVESDKTQNDVNRLDTIADAIWAS